MEQEKSAYDRWLEIENENEKALAYARSVFGGIPARNFFEMATLRLLVAILKTLTHVNRKI